MYKSRALDIGAPSCAAKCGLATWLRLSWGMSNKARLSGTTNRSTMVAKSGRLWYSRFLHKDSFARQPNLHFSLIIIQKEGAHTHIYATTWWGNICIPTCTTKCIPCSLYIYSHPTLPHFARRKCLAIQTTWTDRLNTEQNQIVSHHKQAHNDCYTPNTLWTHQQSTMME